MGNKLFFDINVKGKIGRDYNENFIFSITML